MVFSESLVKTLAKLGLKMRKMLFTDAMIKSLNVALDIGNQGNNPGEQLHRIFARAGNHWLTTLGQDCQNLIGLKAIGAHPIYRGDALLGHVFNVLATHLGHLAYRGKKRLSSRSLYGHHHLGLAAGSTAMFAWFGRPKVGIVHLQQLNQLLRSIPIRHGLANLMAYGPHHFVGVDLQRSLQRQHGDAAFFGGKNWSMVFKNLMV
jgi:hypothetical protein